MAGSYDIPLVVDKRVRFFDGQYLQDEDFIAEQRYHIAHLRSHLRLAHGSGIVDGLAVTATGANEVTIAPGTAVDGDGRVLALAAERTLKLAPAAKYKNQTGIRIYLVFQEQESDPQQDVGSKDNTRFQAVHSVEAVLQNEPYTPPHPPVLLAQISVGNQGAVTVDLGARLYAGVRLPGQGTEAVVLRTTAAGNVGLTGTLTTTGSIGAGTANPRARLEVAVDPNDGTMLLTVGKGGASSLTVHNNGNVGIGTPNPGARLELAVAADDASTTKPLAITKGTATFLAVTSGGRVGINTTEPSSPLHVKLPDGPLGFEQAIVVQANETNSDGGRGGGIVVKNFDVMTGGVFGVREENNWKGALAFYTHTADSDNKFAGTFTEKLRINSEGNVGIGTPSPVARLQVVVRQADSTTKPLVVSKGASNYLVVGNNGNVGIGTDAADAFRLMVYGGNTFLGGSATVVMDSMQGDFINLYNTGPNAGQDSRIVWRNGGETKYAAAIGSRPGDNYNRGDLRFMTGVDGALNVRMSIYPGGDICIGGGLDRRPALLTVQGSFCERLDLIAVNNRGDWGSPTHGIKQYFSRRLTGMPIGTMMRAIADHPDWRGHYWQGWVDAGGQIRVVHNSINTGETAPAFVD